MAYTHKFGDGQKISLWDVPANISHLPRHILLRSINICAIFCHLSNSSSCRDVSYWYSLIQKYRPGVETVLVAVSSRNSESHSETEERNQNRLLDWCRNVLHRDLPYMKINLSTCGDDFSKMYRQLTDYILEKLKIA